MMINVVERGASLLLQKILTAFIFVIFLQPIFAQDVALTPRGEEILRRFALAVASSSLKIQALQHDLESARNQKLKSQTPFAPVVSISESTAKAANTSYNSSTGLDEDYSTRRRGTVLTLKQRTPLGTGRFDIEKSNTDYTSAQTTYFRSRYFSLETDLIRRAYKINAYEKKLGRGAYTSEKAGVDSQMLDILMEAFSSLFDRLIAYQNHLFKTRNISFYKNLVEEAEVKLKNGLGSELDLKQARMRSTLAETGVEESRINLDEADRKLALCFEGSGWDTTLASFTSEEVASSVPDVFDAAELLTRGIKARPDIRLLDSQLENQKITTALARENAKPDVAASIRWGRQGRAAEPDLADQMRDKSWDFLVTWSTTIGPRPERLDKKIESQKLAALKLRRDQAEAAAKKAISATIERIKFHKKNLLDLKDSSRLSGEVLEGQRLNFQLGKISLLDLNRYQSDYEEACLSVIRAESSLVLSWLQLLYEVGELPMKFGIKQADEPGVPFEDVAASR